MDKLAIYFNGLTTERGQQIGCFIVLASMALTLGGAVVVMWWVL